MQPSIRNGKFMFVRNELRQLHEGSEQTGDTIDWNGDGSDEDAVHDLYNYDGTIIMPKKDSNTP